MATEDVHRTRAEVDVRLANDETTIYNALLSKLGITGTVG